MKLPSQQQVPFVTDESAVGNRLDSLYAYFDFLSRSKFQQTIKSGFVTLNASPETTPSYRLRASDTITVVPHAITKQPIDFTVLYEDEQMLVIYKPAGVLMHARGNEDSEFTVADYIRSRTTDDLIGRAGIVHRLDRETSGVVLLSKTKNERERLQHEFAERKVIKEYRALCRGQIVDEAARFEWPIERHPKKPYSFRVGMQGKSARTLMKLVSVGRMHSEVKLLPKTGRTHQLRVHMQQYGHPILGDSLYNDTKRHVLPLMLHAYKISFINHSGEMIDVTAPLPWTKQDIERYCNGE